MSKEFDNNIYCMCGDDSFYDWDKEGNKCVTCGNEIFEKKDAPILKTYTFIHPLTGTENEIYCEILTEDGIVGGDSYYQCLIENEVIAQFPKSYAMMRTD